MRLQTLLPRQARYRLRSLRHQLDSGLRATLSARRPVFEARHTAAELSEIAAAARAARPQRAESRTLEVVAVERPTRDSVRIEMANPADRPIRFRPGQFLTLEVEIDGETHRRQYSFCSDPSDAGAVAVAVRRVPGGVVSNHLVDTVRVGDRLETSGPSGRFGTEVNPDVGRRVVLVAGGAGITPLWSIAQALVAAERRTTVDLVYANRGISRVIFRDEIDALARRSDALRVTHVLERPSKSVRTLVGRLEGAVLDDALPVDPGAEYYVCGPAPMMDGVTSWLRERGVPGAAIRTESFVRARRDESAEPATWEVRFARSGVVVEASSSRSLLEIGRAAGVDMPFSCSMGGCAACKCRLRSGDVHMPAPNCLTPAEAERGEVLACIAQPRSPVVVDA